MPIGLLTLIVMLPIFAQFILADSGTRIYLPVVRNNRASYPSPAPSPTPTPPSGPAPIAGQPCPQWYHDRITTTGPDGQQYPTWHPAVDPASGCVFGHEHGVDPRTSKADNTMPAFGYAAAQMGMTEPHVGFKVFVIHYGQEEYPGRAARGDFRAVLHMGTSGVKRYTEQHHSLEYDFIARDGTGRYAHIYGMADTGNGTGSTCTNPRDGGRDFSTVGCQDPYEIWNNVNFRIKHPDDPFSGEMEVRAFLSMSAAVFDPVTTRDPANNDRLLYSQDYYRPGSGVDPLSTAADFRGCKREMYGGPSYWNNAGRPTTYWTDVFGNVQPGPGPGLILQEISAVKSTSGEVLKIVMDSCEPTVHAPN